jgi:SAM-dependent methyltransferase
MAQWDDGYVTDVVYTSNFYRECSPSWLAAATLLLGHRPPDLAGPFRFADLGCGHGSNALVAAACSPQAEIWAFDFNPAHIESATRLAAQAGIGNIRYVEASFADIAALPDAALPSFDIVVSHGVLSWISAENRRHLFATIARRLKPGGIAYLGYNTATGWASMVPVRALMRQLVASSPERTDLAVKGVLDTIDRLREAGALYFAANPTVEQRLAQLRQQDPRYFAHELLNADWHPAMFAEVAAAMAEAKCSFIGSATLADNIPATAVPAGVAALMAETHDPVLRDTLRDFGAAQGFRRDIFRRGLATMPAGEHQTMVEALSVARLGQRVPEGGVTFATPVGTVTGRPDIYEPLLALLEQGPLSVRQAASVASFEGRPVPDLLQAMTLLMHGGYAHPLLAGGDSAAARESVRGLNQAIAQASADGADMPRLVLPALGAAIQVDVIETLVVGALLRGQAADVEPLVEHATAALARGGRTVQRDGTAVTDPSEMHALITEAVRLTLARVPLLRELGVLFE